MHDSCMEVTLFAVLMRCICGNLYKLEEGEKGSLAIHKFRLRKKKV